MGKRIKDLSRAETDGDLAVDNATNGTGKMNTSVIFNNFAGKFVENSTQAIKNKTYTYQGVLYKAKENYQGPWDATKFESVNLSAAASAFYFVENEEYLLAILDSEEHFLFGIKKENGSPEWQVGIPTPVKSVLDEILLNMVYKVVGKSLVDSVFADAQSNIENPEFIRVLTDNADKIMAVIKTDGAFSFKTSVEFPGGINWSEKNISELSEALKTYGFTSGQGDWSDSSSLSIPKPRCAVVNFSGIDSMPASKTADLHGVLEFWDMSGNYFKKNVIMNAQGQSTMSYPKKNIAIDICNDNWIGDDTFKLKIGDWVVQDSFHIKAAYNDFMRGVACVTYDIFDEIERTLPPWQDAPWKKALIDFENLSEGKGLAYAAESSLDMRLDTGARNHPLGFPCIVFLKGTFYGIFFWQLKKHRDNYHMDKSNTKEIHLDGRIDENYILGGTIDWTQFEVRNPKSLICMDGSNYDGDNPEELIDSSSVNYNPANSKHVKTAQVKARIEALSDAASVIRTAKNTYGIDSDEVKEAFETYYDVDNIIDYLIFIESINDVDSTNNNWQWTTYDGVKWYVNPYDLDASFGKVVGYVIDHRSEHLRCNMDSLPLYYITHVSEYNSRLEARYAFLRDRKIVDVSNYLKHINSFVQAVGMDFFKKESEKWPETLSNNNFIVSEKWEVKVDANGKPIMGNSQNYSAATTYSQGSEVTYGLNSTNGYYTFIAKQTTTGTPPVTTWRFRDSYWRTAKWLVEQFNRNDLIYNYNGG